MNTPHVYVQQKHGGGACAACGCAPEHSLHTYTLPGFEEFTQALERKATPAPQMGLFV